MLKYAHFLFFTLFLEIVPVFFSRARSTAGKSGTGTYQPPYQPYMSFGSQGWTALFHMVDTAGPKV